VGRCWSWCGSGFARCEGRAGRYRPPTRSWAALAVPKPGHVSRWLLTHPDRLDDDLPACPPARLLDAVEADNLPALHSLATDMRRDLDAVMNGLTLEHDSGAVEGAVTRAITWNLFCQAAVDIGSPARRGTGRMICRGHGHLRLRADIPKRRSLLEPATNSSGVIQREDPKYEIAHTGFKRSA
jgi:hypothetical protein